MDIGRQQYDWICKARGRMFGFLEGIPLNKLQQKVPYFGHETIIATQFHVADSYQFWFGEMVRRNPGAYQSATTDEVQRADLQSVRDRFSKVDELVKWFLAEYDGKWFEEITLEVPWQNEVLVVTPLYLLTHVQTHEFHHKGQILIMAKYLGYTPPADDSLGGL
ncbi:DinB family protein [Alicyclobacillus sp. SO9]|uniref:DinB family protein n=1 Tax=Alicyclobacillus sp. SO9 TaxID=2665646 RepID=UPI0018E7059F|nr:DinB family protein [Alicyclobacillus sp. SO9]QQE81327.1 DinB family protein [Alicyclobacillus sp. SO9]